MREYAIPTRDVLRLWDRRGGGALLRHLWVGCSLCVILYSLRFSPTWPGWARLACRCMFGTKVEEEVPADYEWRNGRRCREVNPAISTSPPSSDWRLAAVIRLVDVRDKSYSDYIRTLRGLSNRSAIRSTCGGEITIRGMPHSALVTVQYPPSWTYYRSCVWFLQELLIFAIGARVFWKRPDDESAQLFFAVCIVTVGAFMGAITGRRSSPSRCLIYPFALFAVFVPVVNLHFFLVFPRANPVLQQHRRPGAWRALRRSRRRIWWRSGEHVRGALVGDSTRLLADGRRVSAVCAGSPWATSAWRSFLFGLCILCLTLSYRHARDAGRAQPGAVDLAGLADLAGLDRLSCWRRHGSIRRRSGGATPPGRCLGFRSCTRWPMPSASPATS